MLPKRLVFCGGGTRCLVFLQGLVNLETKGVLRDVNEYWGTSAGAMIASLYAFTKSPKQIKDIMFHADYQRFRDIDISNLIGMQQTWGLDDGKSLVQEIERVFDTLQPGGKEKCLKDMPELNIVVSDITVRETVVCNSKTFPNLRIVDALRASMSLPVFFTPYKHPESGHMWIDGAIRANFPWHCLPNDEARSEALGFTFEKPFLYKTPKTFMEYIFSMIHFDEPKKISSMKEKWPNIIWFQLPPYPSWFMRFQPEDFALVERLGKEGIEQWSKSTRRFPQTLHTPKSFSSPSGDSQLPSTKLSSLQQSSPLHIQQSNSQRDCTNALLGNPISGLSDCSHENFSNVCFQTNPVWCVSSCTSQNHTPCKQPLCRRWSM